MFVQVANIYQIQHATNVMLIVLHVAVIIQPNARIAHMENYYQNEAMFVQVINICHEQHYRNAHPNVQSVLDQEQKKATHAQMAII